MQDQEWQDIVVHVMASFALILFFQIFEEVDRVLKPWPHLVKLFIHFLTPEECIETSMVGI